MRHTDTAILHHTASSSLNFDGVIRLHVDKNHWSDGGYHAFIDCNGRLRLMRPLHMVGAHDKSQNKSSIGICMQGDWRETDWFKHNGLQVPRAYAMHLQWITLKVLLNDLKRQGLIRYIEGHMEHEPSSTETLCPGFDPERIRHALGWGWSESLIKRDFLPIEKVMRLTT